MPNRKSTEPPAERPRPYTDEELSRMGCWRRDQERQALGAEWRGVAPWIVFALAAIGIGVTVAMSL
jgi:hypothetical protein